MLQYPYPIRLTPIGGKTIVDAPIFQNHETLPPTADTDLHNIVEMDILGIGAIGADPVLSCNGLHQFAFRQLIVALGDPWLICFLVRFHILLSPHTIRRYAGYSTYYRGFCRKVYGDNTTKYAQNHWNLSKVFTKRGRLIIMNMQISTSGCVLCVCKEKTVLHRKEIPKNTQDTTVNLS